jgi:hypothetical protein
LRSLNIQPVLDGFPIPVPKAPAMPPGSVVSQHAQEHRQENRATYYRYEDHHLTF